MKPLALSPEVDAILHLDAPVAIGVSGGKDSCAVALATVEHLNDMHHIGPRVLVHSDLGRTEWKASLPTCERLARTLGVELMVVRRATGDMMDRWLTRWENNLTRYCNLQCVRLILPWSTPSMRFCTSEMKTAVICRALAERFPAQNILSVSGIRRQESRQRAKAPIFKEQPKLVRRTWDRTLKVSTIVCSGFDWHPILEWTLDDVLEFLAARQFALHEAYTRFGSSRVSCVFCIMSALADLAAAVQDPRNHDIYRLLVDLEIRSTFAFQSGRWLGDVAPHLLEPTQLVRLYQAKDSARQREEIEARIPKHLLYTKGWPTVMPTPREADLLADTRRRIADLIGIMLGQMRYVTGDTITARYAELMAARGHAPEDPVDEESQGALFMSEVV